jgi:hypothetical protein
MMPYTPPTVDEWIQEAADNLDVLKQLVDAYHPANRLPGRRPGDWITAHNPEAACTQVRKAIRDEHDGSNPADVLETAIKNKDVGKVSEILNQAWFGVPENRDCWKIPGFREAVDLIEELPEEEGEDETA